MDRETPSIHPTDLHVGSPEDPRLCSDTPATLPAVLDLVATVTAAPSFVVACGDLTHSGDAARYRPLRGMMAGIGVPVRHALGNHGTRAGFHEGMPDHPAPGQEPHDHDALIEGIHVITRDSSTPGAIGSTITVARFAWHGRGLDTHTEAPGLIVAHHPPALGGGSDGMPRHDIDPAQSERLAGMLAGRNAVGILSGHIHRDRASSGHGVPVIVGTGQHAATAILRPDVLRMVRGASFGIGTIRPSGLTMAFVPLPSDRAELNLNPLGRLRACAPAAAITEPVTTTCCDHNLAPAGLGREATVALIDAFMGANPPIRVEAIPVPSNETLTRVQADIVAGIQPDVAQLLFRDLYDIIDSPGAEPLEERAGAEFAAHMQGMIPRGLELGKVGGKTSGLACTFPTPVISFDADRFRAAGLDPDHPPATWP